MKIAVIGASGRCGRRTVTHALAAGHEVISVVRTPTSAPEGTQVAQADARDTDALTRAITGTDAVVSTLGHVEGDNDLTLLQDGATALVTAMRSAAVDRLVSISAAAAYVAGDDPLSRLVAKPILERVLKDNNVDTRAMEEVITASDLTWTTLRPGRLIDGDSRAHYRSRVDRSVWWHYSTRFDTVGRAAVDALERPEWERHTVFITE